MGINLDSLIYTIPAIIVVLTIHEYSHAKVADILGDPTARNRGRLTLNPVSHLDVLGFLMLLLVRLGWAKPVPVNPLFFKDRKKGMLYVSLAGPLSGVVLALIVRLAITSDVVAAYGPVFIFLNTIYIYSLIISVFNLLPVYPLDGSRILQALLPSDKAFALTQRQHQIQLVFLLIVFVANRLLWGVLNPVINVLDYVIKGVTAIFF